MTRDIIKVFPPEIWMPCIIEACHGERYMVNLSTLTVVSPCWERHLIGARSLWANIYVNDGDEESMAMIPTFLLLSGSYKLTLTIWVPLSRKWDALVPIFVAHRDRIYGISLRSDNLSHKGGCSFKFTIDDNEFCDVLKKVLDNLRRPKSIEYLGVLAERPVTLRLDWVPPNLVFARNWLAPGHLLAFPGYRFKLYYLSIRASDLTNLLQHPSASEQVQHLDIYSDEESASSTPTLKNETVLRLPFLNTLRYYGLFPIDFIQLFKSAARSLQMLDLDIRVTNLDLAIRALNQCENLRHLSLTLFSHERTSGYRNIHGNTFDGIERLISDLEEGNWRPGRLEYFKCEVRSIEMGVMIQNINLNALWLSFCILFPGLHVLVWNIPMRFFTVPMDSMVIADLFHFSVICKREFTIPQRFLFTRLHSLRLTIGEDAKMVGNISTEDFPLLRKLSVTFLGPCTRFDLPNFPLLTEITIKTRLPTFTQGMQFCISLLLDPQKYPCLEQISLDSLLEWDILYLMLRRRNLSADRVSRIKRMRVYDVPAKFRRIFAPLLAGTEVLPTSLFLRLSYLSIQEAQSQLLDAKRKGCFSCVQLGLKDCDEPLCPSELPEEMPTSQGEDSFISEIIEPLGLFPLYEWCSVSPGDSPDEDFWMAEHQRRIEKWRRTAFKWSKLHQRILMCHKQRCSPMVTLTEHDMEGKDSLPNATLALSLSILKPNKAPKTPQTQQVHSKSDLHHEIMACALSIVKRIQTTHYTSRSRAASTLASLAVHDEFREAFSTLIKLIITPPRNENDFKPGDLGSTLVVLASYPELHDIVLVAIELLIKQLEHQSKNIRSTAATDLAVLSSHAELRATVRTATNWLIRRIASEDQSIKRAAALGLVALSMHAELEYAVRGEIEALVEELHTSGNDQLNIFSGLRILEEYEDLRSIIQDLL